MDEKKFNETASKAAKVVVEGVKSAANVAVEAGKSMKSAAETAMNDVKPEVYIQYANQEDSLASIVKKAKESYVSDGHKLSEIKMLKIYMKPEEKAAYYVVNERYLGKIDMF